MSPGKAYLNDVGKRLNLPKPDLANITVLTQRLPNSPVLPWNHYDSPWLREEALASAAENGNGEKADLGNSSQPSVTLAVGAVTDLTQLTLHRPLLDAERLHMVQVLKQLVAMTRASEEPVSEMVREGGLDSTNASESFCLNSADGVHSHHQGEILESVPSTQIAVHQEIEEIRDSFSKSTQTENNGQIPE